MKIMKILKTKTLSSSSLGITIVGGSDTPLRCVVVQEVSVFFNSCGTNRHKSAHFLLFQVFPEGLVASDGRLQPGDQIIEINGADMTCATHAQVTIMEAGV